MTTAVVAAEELRLDDDLRGRGLAALALVEARRLLTHPAYLVGLAYVLTVTGTGLLTDAHDGRKEVIDVIEVFALFLFAMISIFPASLVATSARRAGADEMLAAVPTSPRTRTVAVLLGAGAPAAIATAAVLVSYALRQDLPPTTDIPPLTGVAAASTALLYLGTAAVACAAARWVPWPGVPLVLLVGLVSWVGNTHASHHAAAVLTAPWIAFPDRDVAVYIAGYSGPWHVAYLTGLVALAAIAALYRDDLRRMLLVALPAGLFTGLAAWAQLP